MHLLLTCLLRRAWESSYEFLVNDKDSTMITVQVVNDVDFSKDPLIGKVVVSLADLLMAKEQGKDWFPLSGCKLGRLRLTADWKPLGMTGSVDGSAGESDRICRRSSHFEIYHLTQTPHLFLLTSAFVPPIGIVRVHMKKALDLK
jgi:hypothetical protein